jgi:ubiquinone biosynthesis protein UbiJ
VTSGPDGSDRAARLPSGLAQLVALLADGLGEFATATLALDPVGAARLAALEGARILIRARPPAGMPGPEEIPFGLRVTSGRLRVVAGPVERPRVIVSGSIADLARWALARGATGTSGLQIDGDTQVLETLAAIAHDYRPEFEPPLTRLLGPGPAKGLIEAAEFAFAGLRTVLQTAATGVRQGAGQWFATESAAARFLDELDELKLAVDRLEARVAAAELRRHGAVPDPGQRTP